ncbi:MAG TPA: sodium:proton exchanger, partial [Actinomycetota bacterium]|nr:sodium:proton exchanger [Actinomycetota bacterium]
PALPHPVEAVIFGLAIVGAAFLLSWAAEAAQVDISAALAIAVLALIAVLPEYAVDFVFAFKGGKSVQAFGESCPALGGGAESPCSLALANMTGANRLLIGVGWSMVAFIAWYRYRRGVRPRPSDERNTTASGIILDRQHSIELGYLAVATLYSLTLPLRESITLVDAAILVSIFAAYTWRVARAPAEDPHLVGPARYVGGRTKATRRAMVAAMFLYAAAMILLTAELFAEALVATGIELGISEFFLVQWLAPLASETPELLVASLFAWRLATNAGLGTLVSSKVNQWTLLVGTLPVVFTIAVGELHGLPIDSRQRQEIFLTAAQSFFAVAILSNLSMSVREAWMLFGLFWAQFILGAFIPEEFHGTELVIVSVIYLLLGMIVLVRDRARLPRLLRDGFLRSHEELRRSPV